MFLSFITNKLFIIIVSIIIVGGGSIGSLHFYAQNKADHILRQQILPAINKSLPKEVKILFRQPSVNVFTGTLQVRDVVLFKKRDNS